jgi:hypothetical protein
LYSESLYLEQCKKLLFYDKGPHGSPDFEFRIYWKPGNAYSYLPYGSYSTRHVSRGWLKAEVQRLLAHSSNPSVWLEDEHLRNRGYPVKAIDATFSSIDWNQRPSHKILSLKMNAEGTNDTFPAEYSGCVFSNRNAPETDQLRGFINLSLKELRTQDGKESRDIFPPRAFFAVRSSLSMGCVLRR